MAEQHEDHGGRRGEDRGERRGERRRSRGRHDRILLRGLRARGFHGVFDHERRDGQDFVVDVELGLDLAPAGASDDLAETVSYAEVADLVAARVTGEPVDLIERLATLISDDVLALPLVREVTVTVHKPQAPVHHDFDDVSVTITRRRPHADVPVVIALGANLGDRVATLEAAVAALAATDGLRVDAVSPLAETDPVGGPDQPAYLNAVVLARTTRSPHGLLAALHSIEADHGRTREIRWGARTLDLDLIQFGEPGKRSEVTSEGARLTLPHPRAHERAFVLVPWSLADPRARLRTETGIRPVADLLAEVTDDGVRPGPTWQPAW